MAFGIGRTSYRLLCALLSRTVPALLRFCRTRVGRGLRVNLSFCVSGLRYNCTVEDAQPLVEGTIINYEHVF